MLPAWSSRLKTTTPSAFSNQQSTGTGSWRSAPPYKSDFRYTSDTVFDTFPWPQSPTSVDVGLVAEASRALRAARGKFMQEAALNLRKLYRLTELPGRNSLKTAQADLDEAVQRAYGMRPKENALPFLLSLNAELFSEEREGGFVQAPGPPSTVGDLRQLVSKDRMEAPQTGVHKFGSKGKKG